MPNWCENTITLSHKDPAMIDRVVKGQEGLLMEFLPTPKELTETVAGFMGEDKRAAHEAQQRANIEKYGYKDWYDWNVANWGTKWDVGGDDGMITEDGPNALRMSFDSAWSPPIPAMEHFMDLGFKVKLIYWESGMCYCGLFDENGDDYYDYSNMTAKEFAEEINPEIDECMCIIENLEMWEEENKDEVQEWYEDGVEKRGLDPHTS